MLDDIKIETIPEKIASEILKLISRGKLKAGDTLPSERKLSELLGVSRSSVREALKYLEVSGFIKTHPGKRTIIKNITENLIKNPIEILMKKDESKIIELTKVRVFLEAYGAREAALNRSNENIKNLKKIIEKMEKDLEKNIIDFKTDFSFHTEIANSTKNTIYMHIIESIHNILSSSLKFYREVLFTSYETQLILLNQHKKIFKNIAEKKPYEAEISMRDHLEFVIIEYYKWINRE